MKVLKCEYLEGDTIIREEEEGDSLFIIKEGILNCIKKGKDVRKLYTKDYFGESSILFGTTRSMSIECHSKTAQCYQITRQNLSSSLGENFKQILLTSIAKDSLMTNCKLIKHLSFDPNFEKIFDQLELKILKNNQIIIRKDKLSEKLIIIVIEGNLISV